MSPPYSSSFFPFFFFFVFTFLRTSLFRNPLFNAAEAGERGCFNFLRVHKVPFEQDFARNWPQASDKANPAFAEDIRQLQVQEEGRQKEGYQRDDDDGYNEQDDIVDEDE